MTQKQKYLNFSLFVLPSLALFFVFTGYTPLAFATELSSPTTTPSSPIQKVFEGVKGGLDTLLSAKDNKNDDLSLRITTFEKVLSFVITEAKDLKLKLLALDTINPHLTAWREKMVEHLTKTIELYNTQKEFFEKNYAALTLDEVKKISEDLRITREEEFILRANEIQNFLLLDQQNNAIEISTKRLQKINEDVKKLEKAKIKGMGDLQKLLTKAGKFIEEGKALNLQATEQFVALYVTSLFSSSTPTSTRALEEISLSQNNPTSSSRVIDAPPSQEQIVRTLILQSLAKIKDAYQTFLDMSALVKKLLK